MLSITEKGLPVVDGIKLQRLRQLVRAARPAPLPARAAPPSPPQRPRTSAFVPTGSLLAAASKVVQPSGARVAPCRPLEGTCQAM